MPLLPSQLVLPLMAMLPMVSVFLLHLNFGFPPCLGKEVLCLGVEKYKYNAANFVGELGPMSMCIKA